MPGGGQNRFLVQIVWGSHNHRVHIGTGAERIQVRFHLATKLRGNGFGVFGVKHAHDSGPVLLLHDAAKLRAKITGSNNGISNGFHIGFSFYLT